MFQFPFIHFDPDISVFDPIRSKTGKKFDLIATNPPWGHHFSKKALEALQTEYPHIRTGESFSYFIQAGMNLLSPGGHLSYLLPEALLKVKTHKDIRNWILENSSIENAVYLGKIFSKVQTQVVRLDLAENRKMKRTTVLLNNKAYSVNNRRFKKNPHYIFDFNCSERDQNIIEKVFSRSHKTLENRAKWILGVVSGNNSRFLSSSSRKKYFPIISGKDISSFSIRKPTRYIYFNRKILQQSAPLNMYRLSPKVVYRFVTGKPVFALDRKGLVTLNSANSFYTDETLSPELIAALFNSALYRFILRKKFNSLKVLRNHLEYLPIPDLSKKEETDLIDLTLQCEGVSVGGLAPILDEINDRVFNIFEIDHSDRNYILEFDS